MFGKFGFCSIAPVLYMYVHNCIFYLNVHVYIIFSASIVKLSDNQELPTRSKNNGKEESDVDGIRTCENCMELLERSVHSAVEF